MTKIYKVKYMMDKRTFLKSFSILSLSASGILFPSQIKAATNNRLVSFDTEFWNRSRRLHIYRPLTKENLNITFFENGSYNLNAYKRLCWIFRDVKSSNATQYIDIALFNLLFGIQEWARRMGSYEPIYKLYSGYRTDYRNKTIEGAAKNSMHIYGKAADGVFATIPLKTVIQMAKYFGAGGIGGYSTFIHLDTSKYRKWGNA